MRHTWLRFSRGAYVCANVCVGGRCEWKLVLTAVLRCIRQGLTCRVVTLNINTFFDKDNKKKNDVVMVVPGVCSTEDTQSNKHTLRRASGLRRRSSGCDAVTVAGQ